MATATAPLLRPGCTLLLHRALQSLMYQKFLSNDKRSDHDQGLECGCCESRQNTAVASCIRHRSGGKTSAASSSPPYVHSPECIFERPCCTAQNFLIIFRTTSIANRRKVFSYFPVVFRDFQRTGLCGPFFRPLMHQT